MRTFSVPTLERWYYACRRGGLAEVAHEPLDRAARATAAFSRRTCRRI
jgi:hypothetical protein